MLNSKLLFVPFLFLCSVTISSASPIKHNLNEGRGVASTLWGWISYPFTWWSYGAPDFDLGDPSTGSPTNEPFNIEIGKHNVTVWCNDQTCTTMRCDKFGCSNVTCNIYDTDLTGECRSYNTLPKPDDNIASQSTEALPKPEQGNNNETNDKVPEGTVNEPSSAQEDKDHHIDEKPLQLEAVLSSTVTEGIDETDEKISK
ncbi:uncharacterized protein LOC126975949 [Leptidea sinapis]|uniref:uncharacterized protein LOC126975949 n=1 Tax=Leptidea sinapis TaxID=189913 RepID=UPI0021C47950|nr:uncharacterized protein LOC126975949 [Leptidea sinapis]